MSSEAAEVRAAPAQDEASAKPTFSRLYRGWFLTVLLLVNALNLSDRQAWRSQNPRSSTI